MWFKMQSVFLTSCKRQTKSDAYDTCMSLLFSGTGGHKQYVVWKLFLARLRRGNCNSCPPGLSQHHVTQRNNTCFPARGRLKFSRIHHNLSLNMSFLGGKSKCITFCALEIEKPSFRTESVRTEIIYQKHINHNCYNFSLISQAACLH